ncbi:MAG TPA: DUF362 domain-containing protein [Planctomycetota bacterium]|nr:DUF362 domain-containing protein [Planctomycetota bacterium]
MNAPALRVFVARCETYDPQTVQQKVDAAFGAFGGVGRFVRPGMRVLVKPNLLLAAPPEKAVTTHPAVVEAAVRLLLDAGAKVTIGDSPGIVHGTKAAEKAGILDVAQRLGVKVIDFDDPVELKTPDGFLFKRIEVARAVAEADAIINLPKFKSHGQMVMTLAVKNLFGCVVGHRKAQWHMAAGRDHDTFARLLLELSALVAPAFSVVDGVIGMDGNGPSAGRVRPVNVILAGDDPLAIDRIGARIAGLDDARFPLIRAARKMPACARGLGRIEVVGDPVDSVKLADFNLPMASDLQWLRLKPVRRLLKRAITARPAIDRARCEACGVCVCSCPPRAMTIAEGQVTIDRSLCISCFCCQEMCPQHAVDVRHGWLARILFQRSRPHARSSGDNTLRDSGNR